MDAIVKQFGHNISVRERRRLELTLAEIKNKISDKTLNNNVLNPTSSEDGFVISWNDTNQEYELVAQV